MHKICNGLEESDARHIPGTAGNNDVSHGLGVSEATHIPVTVGDKNVGFGLWVFQGVGSLDSLLVKHRTRDRKSASSNPSRSCGRNFFSRVNLVCWLLFCVCSTPLLLQWHVKVPGHSVKSAGGRLHLNMRTPLTQWSQSRLTMSLSGFSVGISQETSSHTTHQGTLGNSHLNLLSHCGLILA